ncbi:MAG TPA: carboxypeptidase-like regulatory domain-containing protein [Terriglobia bacterium]|nr:carboxypeptidase-like regulatory domain-containing protein [Terriglobia bacterium]
MRPNAFFCKGVCLRTRAHYSIGVVIALFLLFGAWLAQGIPVAPNQSGTVTGLLRTAAGAPAVGVRVSALARPEQIAELAESTSLAAIAQTDASGQFRLENIPPGRYYIVAGRIDLPTYYPGVVIAKDGTAILVTAGATVAGIDFALNDVSAGRAISFLAGTPAPAFVIPMQTRIEGGGRIPIFEGGRFPVLRLARTDSPPIEAPLSAGSVSVTNTEYRATVENLPDGYTLKSFTFGSADLKTSVLKPGSSQMVSVVLQRAATPQRPGARISGRISGDINRSVYISGVPGTIYADGTFEFIGVPPGRHTLVTLDNPGRERALGASLVVGDQNLLNLELEEVPVVPLSAAAATAPTPPGNFPPNSRLPLGAIRGRVVDGMTGQPLDAGKVVINNDHNATVSLDTNGRFEVRGLLPGNYSLEIAAYGVGIVSRSVVLVDRDAELDVRISAEP